MPKGTLVLKLVCKNCKRELCATNKGKPCPDCGSTEQEWKEEYDENFVFRRGG